MLRNVFLKTLRDQRRSLVWWGIGMVALTVLDIEDLVDILAYIQLLPAK